MAQRGGDGGGNGQRWWMFAQSIVDDALCGACIGDGVLLKHHEWAATCMMSTTSTRTAYAEREKHPLPGVVLLDLNLPGFDVLMDSGAPAAQRVAGGDFLFVRAG